MKFRSKKFKNIEKIKFFKRKRFFGVLSELHRIDWLRDRETLKRLIKNIRMDREDGKSIIPFCITEFGDLVDLGDQD